MCILYSLKVWLEFYRLQNSFKWSKAGLINICRMNHSRIFMDCHLPVSMVVWVTKVLGGCPTSVTLCFKFSIARTSLWIHCGLPVSSSQQLNWQGVLIGSFRFTVICNQVWPFYLSVGSSLLQTVNTSLWPKENFYLNLRDLDWLAMLDSLVFGRRHLGGWLYRVF